MSALNNFIFQSEELKEFVGLEFKPSIAILGSFNAGKSTLLNRLLGENISPVGALPTTDCLLYFNYADSFSAKYTGARGKYVFSDRARLISFLEGRQPSGGRVDIKLPSPILRKCRLIDTPGIDAFSHESMPLAQQAASEATRIIYLFHQRGIENFSRLFLYKLASIWKHKKLEDISFWLNCSLGECDGTSLEATRAELRKIFLSKVRLNAINTLRPENIQSMCLFLEVELAQDYFHNLAKKLKKVDREIPARLKKITKIKDDSLFLSEFWTARETAKKLLSATQSFHSMPLIAKETEELIESINSLNVIKIARSLGVQRYHLKATGLKESKKLILALINELMQEKQLNGLLERSKLKTLSGEISKERFTVIAAGGFSTGKSTFFNALMKEKILLTGSGPTTSSITRISHGSDKIATVHLPLQVTLPIYESTGGINLLCREELNTLGKWLANENIVNLEVCQDSRYRQVDRYEMMALLSQTRDLFATGGSAGSNRAPAVFKPVSDKAIARKKALQMVRLTFKDSGTQKFCLSDPASAKEFRELTKPDHAFRIAGINIEHPSELLKTADFIDTPGFDSIQKHYFRETFDSFRQCDAYLVFLNAKHILHDLDREHLKLILLPQTLGNFNKFFFVINFSDTLPPSQRETVANYVRRNLTNPPAPDIQAIPNPKIFLISALGGLTGTDRGMELLLKNIEEEIMRYRGWDFFRNKLDELYTMLNDFSEKITRELFQYNLANSRRKNRLRQALDILRESRRKIKNIRSTIYNLRRS
ncbi:MAG: dynamin family protein [Desulfotomaculaceae bacterium]|nr:dynamin family protein [Desulfotomaculaceae bacterium]